MSIETIPTPQVRFVLAVRRTASRRILKIRFRLFALVAVSSTKAARSRRTDLGELNDRLREDIGLPPIAESPNWQDFR